MPPREKETCPRGRLEDSREQTPTWSRSACDEEAGSEEDEDSDVEIAGTKHIREKMIPGKDFHPSGLNQAGSKPRLVEVGADMGTSL